jgi:small subunit ribosomal protein S11
MNEEVRMESSSARVGARGGRKGRRGKAKRLRLRKKLLTKLRRARFYISLSKRNVTVCLSDGRGNILAWCTGGRFGFKGSRRGSAIAARYASRKVVKAGVRRGVREAEIVVRGFGRGRQAAIRAIGGFKVRSRSGRLVVAIKVRKLVDFTRIPHNGCRLPRKRHVRRRRRCRVRTLLAPFTTKKYWRGVRKFNRYPSRKKFGAKRAPYRRKLLA